MTVGRGIFLAYILIAIMFAAYRYACGEAINWRMTFCLVWPFTFGLIVFIKLATLIGGKEIGVVPMRNDPLLDFTPANPDNWKSESHNCVPPPQAYLSFELYQQLADRTRSHDLTDRESFAMAAMGACGEAGEMADLIKKHLYHHHPLDKDKLTKEIGDVLWYLAAMATEIGVSLHEVAQQNIDKLKKRYPQGFTTENSINRTE